MKILCFNDLIYSDLSFKNIIATNLCWQAKFQYSYRDTPRPDSGIILILSKGLAFCEEGNTIFPKVGDILYIPAGIRYYVKCSNDNTAMQLINFTATQTDGEKVVFSDRIIKLAEQSSAVFENLFYELQAVCLKGVSNKLMIKIKFFEILLQLLELSEKTCNLPIHNAVTYINNNLTEDIKIPQLAKICAISESTLRREFKKTYGKSPVEYINSERIKKAKNMLHHSFLTVSDISNALAFYDEAYFCKIFKQIVGMTPTQYRLNHPEIN